MTAATAAHVVSATDGAISETIDEAMITRVMQAFHAEIRRDLWLGPIFEPRFEAATQRIAQSLEPGVETYRHRLQFLSRHHHLQRRPSPPAHTTIRYILQKLDPAAVEAVFRHLAAGGTRDARTGQHRAGRQDAPRQFRHLRGNPPRRGRP